MCSPPACDQRRWGSGRRGVCLACRFAIEERLHVFQNRIGDAEHPKRPGRPGRRQAAAQCAFSGHVASLVHDR